MLRALKALFVGHPTASAQTVAETGTLDAGHLERVRESLLVLNNDPYLQIADRGLGVLSVFDDLKYDRADADILSPAMRRHAVQKLAELGFRQISGTVLEEAQSGLRVLIPKFHALGASPFDATRYTPKRPQDLYLLTPTQTACMLVDTYGTDEAVDRIKSLISKHPINIYRLMDYLDGSAKHRDFLSAIGHLKYVQREAISSEPLSRRRALG